MWCKVITTRFSLFSNHNFQTHRDFIEDGTRKLRQEMFAPVERFNCAILNPPYKKINSDSETRLTLREVGIETSNLYTGFLTSCGLPPTN